METNTENSPSEVKVRKVKKADLPFILSSWFESYWKAHASKRGLAYETYKSYQDDLIKRLLHRSLVLVACPVFDDTEILGYSVTEGSTLHYVYVKSVYRRMGIATGLASMPLTVYTHGAEKPGRRFAESLGLLFNPYLAGALT